MPDPAITLCSPSSGITTGGTAVTITGTDLTSIVTVYVGGVAATSVSVVNSTTITCLTPPGTAGACDVGIETAGGAFYTALVNGFIYVALGSVRGMITTQDGRPLSEQLGDVLLIQGSLAQLGVTGTYDAETEDEEQER